MNDFITVKASFKVLTADDGGKRIGFIKSGYRPDHIFEFHKDGTLRAYIGEIALTDREYIYPGEEAEVIVRFLKREPIIVYIQVGRKWSINEANNKIGEGTILEIIEN